MVSREKWKLAEIPISEVVPAELNANKMSKDDFALLVSNIGQSGLSSTITCYKRESDGKYVIISGHHRYEACKKNGYSTIACIYADEKDLTKDEIIAIQLSHNSLHGEDDKGILKRLFEEIQSVNYKQFAHINIAEIDTFEGFSASITPVSEHFVMTLILYKSDIDALGELVGNIDEGIRSSEIVLVSPQEENEELLMQLMKVIGEKYNIKSTNVKFSKILELAKKAMDYDTDNND